MSAGKKEVPEEKERLHPRNCHRGRYNFAELIVQYPELAPYAKDNIYGVTSIDFFNPEAIRVLNRILLRNHYDIQHWDLPLDYLCPPIPGRADYLHYAADMLAGCNEGVIPTGKKIRVLDIGVGANCIYPIIGVKEYGWSFVGADIDHIALRVAGAIVQHNPVLKGRVELRSQSFPTSIFHGIIRVGEKFDLTICNPPFHASAQEAQSKALRKLNSLTQRSNKNAVLHFGGQSNELWCRGGEAQFVSNMARESREFATSCLWFSSLISKGANLKVVYAALERAGAFDVKTIPMGQGGKTSRVVAWTFLSEEEQARWVKDRWQGK